MKRRLDVHTHYIFIVIIPQIYLHKCTDSEKLIFHGAMLQYEMYTEHIRKHENTYKKHINFNHAWPHRRHEK